MFSFNYINFFYDQYIDALIILIFTSISLIFLKKILYKFLYKIAIKTENTWDDFFVDILNSLGYIFLIFLSIKITATWVDLPMYLNDLATKSFVIVMTYQIALSIQMLIRKIADNINEYLPNESADIVKNTKGIVQVIVWVFAIMFLLANIGYNISSLIAGLGVGGIAIAFALQNTLGDLFSAFSIILDKPFKNGDFISFDDVYGTIISTGLKTTKIRSLGGEEVIVANQSIIKSEIRNFSRMKERRVVLKIGIIYESSLEQIKKTKQVIIDAIEKQQDVRLDRVNFFEFGDFSLNFEAIYYVLSAHYNVYMDIQEMINFDILEALEKENIQIAYPTQKIFLEK